MISVRIFNGVVLSILAALAATPAAADPSGFYADVDLGQVRYPYSTVVDSHGVALSAVNHSTKDTSWGGIIGYRFTPYFGSEVGYVNLGKGTAPVSDASGATAARGEASFTSKGPALALTGAVQLANWKPFSASATCSPIPTCRSRPATGRPSSIHPSRPTQPLLSREWGFATHSTAAGT